MRFLIDHDVYAVTSNRLRELGHDGALVGQQGLAQAEDADLLRIASERSRILLTRDRDFGALVFVQRQGPGVIYLRMQPSTCNVVHDDLIRVLSLHSEPDLQASFVVVEPGRHRIRKVQTPG